jgi:hypothetical protein
MKEFVIQHWTNLVDVLMAVLTFLAILVALFGKEFVNWLTRPALELTFDMKDTSCFHEIKINGHPGANSLLKISNQKEGLWFLQRQTAKNVEAKITYIYQGGKKFTYHPTNLTWSGGGDNPFASIVSGSHHFLDFIT